MRSRAAAVAAALIAAAIGALPSPAAASVFTVDSNGDNVAVVGTLRWAVAQANGDVTAPKIDIVAGLEIDLTCAGGGPLAYDNPAGLALTIAGNGAVIRQTCPASPVIETDDDLVIERVVITGGTDGGIVAEGDVRVDDSVIEGNSGGAGVEAFTGDVTVNRSTIRGNSGGIGGGIAAIDAVIDRSTFNGNQGTNGAGIWVDQTASLVNSTVTQNTATGAGGGVLSTNSDITLVHVTIVDNSAPSGANIAMLTAGDLDSFAAAIGLPAGGGADCALAAGATPASQGYNFTSDGSCGLDSALGDLAAAGDPEVLGLANTGGPTSTRSPAASSPLLNHVACAPGVPIDQRGVTRPQGAACEIGAVEIEPPPPSTTTTTPVTVAGSPTTTSAPAAAPTLPATGPGITIPIGIAVVALGLGSALAARRRGAFVAEGRRSADIETR